MAPVSATNPKKFILQIQVPLGWREVFIDCDGNFWPYLCKLYRNLFKPRESNVNSYNEALWKAGVTLKGIVLPLNADFLTALLRTDNFAYLKCEEYFRDNFPVCLSL